jgi:hypothetical protein
MGHPSLWGRSDLGHPPNEAEERRNGVPLLPSGWGAGDSLGMHTVTAVFGETRVFQRKKLRATPPPGAGTHATEVPPRDNRCPSEGLPLPRSVLPVLLGFLAACFRAEAEFSQC